MLEKDRQLEIIRPATMTFLFQLSEGECHKQRTGICSLDRTRPDRSQDVGDESDYDFCPKLFRSLRNGSVRLGRKMPVDIIEYKCGHFAFNDGQHRTCIAKRKNLTLEAEVSKDSKRLCRLCKGDNSDSALLW